MKFIAFKSQLELRLGYRLNEEELKKYLIEQNSNGQLVIDDNEDVHIEFCDYSPMMISFSKYALIYKKSRTTIQVYKDHFKSIPKERNEIDRCELYWKYSLSHIREDVKGLSESYSEGDYKLLNLLCELSEIEDHRRPRDILLEAVWKYTKNKYPYIYDKRR